MHQKYAKNGLVCMSVSLDEQADHDKALQFLRKQKATFANFRLAEETSVWQEKFDMLGPPVVLVFDRAGVCTKFDFTDPDKPTDYDDVEKAVRQLVGVEP